MANDRHRLNFKLLDPLLFVRETEAVLPVIPAASMLKAVIDGRRVPLRDEQNVAYRNRIVASLEDIVRIEVRVFAERRSIPRHPVLSGPTPSGHCKQRDHCEQLP